MPIPFTDDRTETTHPEASAGLVDHANRQRTGEPRREDGDV